MAEKAAAIESVRQVGNWINDEIVASESDRFGEVFDSATGEQIIRIIEELNESDKTILMVTHEAEVAAHARTRLHLRDGAVVEIEGEA